MKATDLLLNQHRDVEQLFDQIEGSDLTDRAVLRDELANNLAAHSAIEKSVLYPAAVKAMGSPELLREFFEEHALVEYELARFTSIRPDDPSFEAKEKVLKEMVLRHVREEESELLPQLDRTLSSPEQEQLGARMEAAFEDAMDKGYKAVLSQALGLRRPRAAAKKTGRAAAAKKAARRPAVKAPRKRAAAPKRAKATTRAKATSRTSSRARAAERAADARAAERATDVRAAERAADARAARGSKAQGTKRSRKSPSRSGASR